MRLSPRTAATIVVAIAVFGCEGPRVPSAPSSLVPLPTGSARSLATTDGAAVVEEFRVCKTGSSADFDYSVSDRNTLATTTGHTTVADGECQLVYVAGGKGAIVTITELVPAGYALNNVDVSVATGAPPSAVTTHSEAGPTVLDSIGGDKLAGGLRGVTAMFINRALPLGTIGDFVWSDTDGDGVQDAGEPGIPGVLVTLSGAANATTTTDGAGGYLFTGLAAGNYVVTVGTPSGTNPSPSAQGGDPSKDSNGSPASVTLPTNSSNDLTIDFGFVTIPQTCQDPLASNFGGPLPCVYIPPCPTGSFTYTFITPSGDLVIRYDQFPAPNDNSYGVNAVGWGTHAHRFSDLVGSDHAGFQLSDGGGTVRLSFNVDYISANAAAPSGYASLGVNGGDGKMIVGTATGITATTSLANNLNNINIPGLFNAAHVQQFGSVNLLIDSPPTDAAHLTYVNSDPTLAGWDFHNTYFVTISAAKLASIGFDAATWSVEPNPDQLHNSPAKPCPATTGGTCSLADTKTEIKDKQVKITIANTGAADVFLTDILLNWPSAVNGKLMQVKLGGDVVYDKPDIAGGTAHLTTAELVADQNKRKIPKGKSEVLLLIFEKNVDPNLAHYGGTVSFGPCVLTILPK
jgi:hypothetical protein